MIPQDEKKHFLVHLRGFKGPKRHTKIIFLVSTFLLVIQALFIYFLLFFHIILKQCEPDFYFLFIFHSNFKLKISFDKFLFYSTPYNH